MIDESKLEKPRRVGDKLVSQCPACAEAGRDKAGEHLASFTSGAFHCIADDSAEHRAQIFALIGERKSKLRRPVARSITLVRRSSDALPEALEYPWVDLGVSEDLRNRAAASRKLPAIAFELCESLGYVRYAKACDQTVWTLSDVQNRVHEARRIDGGEFPEWRGSGARKTHSKCNPNGKKWPVGFHSMVRHPKAPILFCEGSADFVAAILIRQALPKYVAVAILGSSLIHDAALPSFRGRNVVIAVHDRGEGNGGDTARKWRAQMLSVGAIVKRLRMESGDLNDAISAGELPEIVEALK